MVRLLVCQLTSYIGIHAQCRLHESTSYLETWMLQALMLPSLAENPPTFPHLPLPGCSWWGKLVTVKQSTYPKVFVFKMDDRSLWELILHYGLFLGGIFQLICILAIVIVPSDNSVDDEGILLNKEDKLRKFQGQQTLQSQTRLRERRKKKWHCRYFCWVWLKFSGFSSL